MENRFKGRDHCHRALAAVAMRIAVLFLGHCIRVTLAHNVTVTVGQTAILHCQSPSELSTNFQVMWTDKTDTTLSLGQAMQTTDRRFSVEQPYARDFNLHITSVRTQDAGLYSCIAVLNTGQRHSTKLIHLIIQVPPSITYKSEGVTVATGSDVTLRCSATGAPLPTIVWYRHRLLEPAVPVVLQSIGGDEWKLAKVTCALAGDYECRAENGVQPPASFRIRVNVKCKPEISMPYRMVRQDLGMDTLLQCILDANPTAQVYWEVLGRRIEPSASANAGKYSTFSSLVGEYRTAQGLQVRSLVDADYAAYRCVAQNELGTAEETVTLSAWRTKSVVAGDGLPITLDCPVAEGSQTPPSSPPGGFTWYFNSKAIFSSSSGGPWSSRYEAVGAWGLRVKRAELGDGGQYRCNFTGGASYAVHLTVVGSATSCPTRDVQAEVGQEFRLTCTLPYSGPAPPWKVSWTQNARVYPGLLRRPAPDGDGGVMESDLVIQATQELDGAFRCDVEATGCEACDVKPCDARLYVIASGSSSSSCADSTGMADSTPATILVILLAAVIVAFVTSLLCVIRVYRRKLADVTPMGCKKASRAPSTTVRGKMFRPSVSLADSDLKPTVA